MLHISKILILLVATVFLAGIVEADTLTLRSGRVITGTYLGGTARAIRMDLGDKVENFDVDQVASLQFQGPAAPVSNSFDRPPAESRPSFSSNGNYPPANVSASAGAEIPNGTGITVRMIDSVNSESAHLGDSFRASVDEPVQVNGDVVIPRGADVTVKLTADRQSGKIRGQTALTLSISTITVNGRPVDVTTSEVTEASASRGSRSTKVIGGTTALGAIIGGLAGGGRGAAVGAASGAAVGTGAEVATSGQKVKIPSETRLTFTLSNSVRL